MSSSALATSAMTYSQSELDLADKLVSRFEGLHPYIEGFRKQALVFFEESAELQKHIHSIRSRVKNPDHLREKILRKISESKERGEVFDVTEDTLLNKVNDLVGIRILHLHTSQFADIHRCLLDIFDEYAIKIIEGPTAKTWDIEYRDTFQAMGIDTEENERMYTSVHYVVESMSKTKVTCEIQVRTLMEEVWGEVDHTINYPDSTKSLPCREQIRALARVTSSATRLVDAIFASDKDFKDVSKDD